jgi:hypothetical protein
VDVALAKEGEVAELLKEAKFEERKGRVETEAESESIKGRGRRTGSQKNKKEEG